MAIDSIEHPNNPEHLARTFKDFTAMVAVLGTVVRFAMMDDHKALPEARTEIYKIDVMWELLQSQNHKVGYREMHARLFEREGDLFNPLELEAAFKAVTAKVMRPMNKTVVANEAP